MSLGREDITIPGRGPDLSFQRTYASASKAEGTLGFGWSHNYDSHLLITSCGEIVLVGGEGSGMRFVDDGQGGLRPLAGFHGSLIANVEDSSFDFYAKDGTRYHYATPRDNRWRLEFIQDTNGNRTTLNYDNGTRQHLVSVVDSAGRSLQLFYQNLNLVMDDDNATPLWSGSVIERIQGPDNLEIVFGYDALARLVSAGRRRAGEEYWRETYAYADYQDTASGYGWDDRYLMVAATDAIRAATTRYGYLNTELDAGFADNAHYPNSFTREVVMPGRRPHHVSIHPALHQRGKSAARGDRRSRLDHDLYPESIRQRHPDQRCTG